MNLVFFFCLFGFILFIILQRHVFSVIERTIEKENTSIRKKGNMQTTNFSLQTDNMKQTEIKSVVTDMNHSDSMGVLKDAWSSNGYLIFIGEI